MHSAEHMLNQTMVRMFDCGRCISAHVEKRKSRIDFRFDRNLTETEVREIEQRMNTVIASNLTVREEFIPRNEAAATYDLARLPDDAGDTLRIIRIGDYDSCPCSGQHVHSTKDIGEFRIISTSWENGVLRIRFKLVGAKGEPDEVQ